MLTESWNGFNMPLWWCQLTNPSRKPFCTISLCSIFPTLFKEWDAWWRVYSYDEDTDIPAVKSRAAEVSLYLFECALSMSGRVLWPLVAQSRWWSVCRFRGVLSCAQVFSNSSTGTSLSRTSVEEDKVEEVDWRCLLGPTIINSWLSCVPTHALRRSTRVRRSSSLVSPA